VAVYVVAVDTTITTITTIMIATCRVGQVEVL
jgi:hypothetical protein